MKKLLPLAVALFAMSLAVGCASKRAKTDGAGGDAVTSGATTSADDSASASGIESAGSVGGDAAGGAGPGGELANRRIIYFAFDSDAIRAEDQALIAQHAQWIAANPGARVRLEGHTDERGTREYNIGLGERRAQAVRRALALQGGSDLQVPTVSFGEERPAVAGESEDAFSQNRRVEIVYGN
ncbi:MAG: peptidoglycan-associated lipoprotein Pal [Gammaproteobacteria bacterium]|nr:peptidoglycan-associated lipoprotein Pal [Gammaproteobacteria bacterium]